MCANEILISIAQVYFYLQSHSLTLRQHIQFTCLLTTHPIHLLALASCTCLASQILSLVRVLINLWRFEACYHV